ncbi:MULTISPECIES: protein rep [Bacillus]|uniref:protein rep n=1 Tax=Bacillus TaxID=1386 RepID=UPI00105DAAB5|nr:MULTISPECIES: protein rep [Bacillus]MBR0615461.1 protein rep [Bacillus safensis]MBR0637418.1 protein rep [Bacillus safensis]MDH3097536.1 protein rep [Bacillus safensis]MDH3097543.1 protein rep [Bacillus safensis]TDU08555.1 plasmid rolling circle replication initiator protein Rep [Bacillus sp. BK450]
MTYLSESNYSILQDKTATGKKRDWRGKKVRSSLMAAHYEGLEQRTGAPYYGKKAEKVCNCAECLAFRRDKETGRLRLYQAYFCKVRLCPMCAWRRSLKIACHNKLIVEEANRQYKPAWIFLTLTVKNVEGDDLKQTISDMMKGFNRLMKYKKVDSSVLGYFRALEITKNHEKNTYHPHFHVLIPVKRSYFKGQSYIKQAEWTSFWKRAMKLVYTPIVHVQRVKGKKGIDAEAIEKEVREAMEEQKAILEISKYPVKDTDVIRGNEVTEENLDTVYYLDDALNARRLIGYGGILKEIHKELNLTDAEDGNLIRIEEDEDEVANETFEVMAYWHVGVKNYIIN